MIQKIIDGVRAMGSIPFFPSDEYSQEAVMTQIGKFVDPVERNGVTGEDRLKWLFDAAINTMRKWEGVAELRGLYCSRFRPADGVEAFCTLPGYSPVDCEAMHIEASERFKEMDCAVQRTGQMRRIA